MYNSLTTTSVVVGVDVHKFSHTAVALNCWGQERGKFEFSNDTLAEYAEWLGSLGQQKDILVALEDVNSYGIHLVSDLARRGFALRYVPAILTERERKQSTKRHKSDYVDAKRVGRVILTKFEETLPAKESIADEQELTTAKTLDLLLLERRDLVKEQTALKNQLHSLLHQYYGDHYADQFPKAFHPKAVAFYLSDLTRVGKTTETSAIDQALAGSVVRRLKRLCLLQTQIATITGAVVAAGEKSLPVAALAESLHGCGLITAASIMAEVVTIKRFNGKDNFAMYSGTAPTEKSSGSKNRLYTNPFGNRLLNRALHTVALSQISRRGHAEGKTYYQKKLLEGKTKLWALRCLKRQIANQVFKILKQATV